MKQMKIAFLTGAVLILAGCEDVKSSDWWQEHHLEAEKKVAECKASGSDSDNCQNAKDGLFRYKQLHAAEPSFKDAFKGIVKDKK
ncbi:hypothetical protein CJE62_15545 [Salmonella enterica]|nr:hypothetical protein [Salmonella enterica]ECJ9309701.1 hypothetical protein [Salmonella enterica]ECP3120334.1 hypothetical protein [Salmonella enterica]EDY1955619.1 EexN family lipoprotein [Salmonella enterica]EEP7774277.1 EexN family lipoprotein [Salmonella enterica]